jgi:hypothetical protein
MKSWTYQTLNWGDRSPAKDPSNLEPTTKKLKELSQQTTKPANAAHHPPLTNFAS